MIVEVLNPSQLLVKGPQVLHTWYESQARTVPGYRFSAEFKSGRWDGRYRPGAWCRQEGQEWHFSCKRGLLTRLVQQFPQATCFAPEWFNENLPVTSVPASLRDYQVNALNAINTFKWCRIAYATNAGKGAIIAFAAMAAVAAGMQVLIACDEISVFNALCEEIAKWAQAEPGRIESGRRDRPHEPIVVAMIPTLARRCSGGEKKSAAENREAQRWREWVSARQMLLLDEADKATSAQWKKVLQSARFSRYRVGFSGTFPDPKKNPIADMVLEELIGPIVLHVANMELVDRGISARPIVELHKFHVDMPAKIAGWRDMAGTERREWAFQMGILFNTERHRFIGSLVEPDPTVIIVNRVDHGKQLENVIQGSVFMDGSVSKTKRKEIISAFQAGEFNPLIVTKIMDRGSNNLGHAHCLIFASGEGSDRQTLQRIGRGLRRGPNGKTHLLLKDVFDTGHDYLQDAALNRLRLYNEQGFEVKIYAETNKILHSSQGSS